MGLSSSSCAAGVVVRTAEDAGSARRWRVEKLQRRALEAQRRADRLVGAAQQHIDWVQLLVGPHGSATATANQLQVRAASLAEN